MGTWPAEQPMGLRERKKARTRAAIQDAALRLYLSQGYHATTVHQIAEAADVSPSTFFRYFPTKEDTVLYDRLDPMLIEAFANQPRDLPPLHAVRAAIREVLGGLPAEQAEFERARQRLILDVRELRTALIHQATAALDLLAEALALRVGRRPDDLSVRTFVGALAGAAAAAFVAALEDPDGEFLDYLDTALDHLESGLPL